MYDEGERLDPMSTILSYLIVQNLKTKKQDGKALIGVRTVPSMLALKFTHGLSRRRLICVSNGVYICELQA